VLNDGDKYNNIITVLLHAHNFITVLDRMMVESGDYVPVPIAQDRGDGIHDDIYARPLDAYHVARITRYDIILRAGVGIRAKYLYERLGRRASSPP